MKKIFTFLLSLALYATYTNAQNPIDIDLWQDGLPNSNGIDKSAPYDDSKQNFKPSIRVFLPSGTNEPTAAVVCCPGGGYSHLAMDHEGYQWADFFNKNGMALIVLKYRMPKGFREVPFSDAQEALRTVRENAGKWNINPDKVGIMGSSAGGHLATTIATHSDSLSAPNFQILFYPVVSMDKNITHMGSRNNLLGKDADENLERQYSNEQQVSKTTPPAIILLSDDDRAVPPRNGVAYYLALKDAGVKASLHVYPSGGHGWGIRDNFKYHTQMISDLQAWIEYMHLTGK